MKKVKLSEWVRFSEIIGVVALVITLGVIVLELKENAKATNAASAIAHTTNMSSWYSSMAKDEKAIANFRKFLENPESCTATERASAVFSLHAMMIIMQNGLYLSKQEVFDETYQQQLNVVLTTITDSRGFQLYWTLRRNHFAPDWQDTVDALLQSDFSDLPTIYNLPGQPESAEGIEEK